MINPLNTTRRITTGNYSGYAQTSDMNPPMTPKQGIFCAPCQAYNFASLMFVGPDYEITD